MCEGSLASVALRQAQGGQRTVKARPDSVALTAGPQVLIATITVMRSMTMESPGTQLALYRCRRDNPLIAARAEELEPKARSSGAPCPVSSLS
jgi:hypothetical protein